MGSETKEIRQKKKQSTKICFDEEVVPQNVAAELNKNNELLGDQTQILPNIPKRKQTQMKNNEGISESVQDIGGKSKKQKRKKTEEEPVADTQASDLQDEQEMDNPAKLQKKESKRAKKKTRHMELILDKKIKNDINSQERSLNYLSKWKHARNDWKFEKNRQVWLKQNMFNAEKIPEEFWETLTEYFSNSQGNVRKNILDEALKIIEGNENDESVLYNRARSIVQCLQE
ncbi:hypothetical protein PPYR_07373 [Photinus pyralis]|nr:hypothetical protein PPYR_07373 [Photinus pyralis]